MFGFFTAMKRLVASVNALSERFESYTQSLDKRFCDALEDERESLPPPSEEQSDEQTNGTPVPAGRRRGRKS